MAFLLSPRRASLGAGAALLIALAAGSFTLAGRAEAAIDLRLAAVFRWIDTDHDGRITRAEYTASLDQPPLLDGVEIVVDTIAPPPPGETRDALFRRLDGNGDGALTLAELAAGAGVRTLLSPAVAAADRNADGLLSEGELAAYLVSQRAAAGVPDPAAGIGLMAHGIIEAGDPNHTGAASLAALLRG